MRRYQWASPLTATENHAHRQNEQRWRTAFENAAIGIIMVDFTGRLFAANSVFRNMLGYTESELYQLTFVDVTCVEDRKANLELAPGRQAATLRNREALLPQRWHFTLGAYQRCSCPSRGRCSAILVWRRRRYSKLVLWRCPCVTSTPLKTLFSPRWKG